MWCAGLCGRVQVGLWQVKKQALPVAQRGACRDPFGASGGHFLQAEGIERTEGFIEQCALGRIVAVDWLDVLPDIGHLDFLGTVGCGLLGQGAFEFLLLESGIFRKRQRVGAEGADGIAVDAYIRMVQGRQFFRQ